MFGRAQFQSYLSGEFIFEWTDTSVTSGAECSPPKWPYCLPKEKHLFLLKIMYKLSLQM